MKLPTTIKANILTRTTTEFFPENTVSGTAKPPERVMTCHNYADGSMRRVNKFDDGSRCVEEFNANGARVLICATDTHGTVAKLAQYNADGCEHTGNGYPSWIEGGYFEHRRHGRLHNLNGYAATNNQYFIDGTWYTTEEEYVEGIRAWLNLHPEDFSQFLVDWDKKKAAEEREAFSNEVQAMVDRVMENVRPKFSQTGAVKDLKDIGDMFMEGFLGKVPVSIDCIHDSITVTIGDKAYRLEEKN